MGEKLLRLRLLVGFFAFVSVSACTGTQEREIAVTPGGRDSHPSQTVDAGAREMTVMASAYNSHPSQTAGDPNEGAWGDKIRPGIRAIAVSRDLLEQGLTRGARVRIDGFTGEYVVLDKMAARWTRKIDIYMGDDVSAAREWGVREVRIRWTP